jgi:hypothetical protein
MSKTIEAIALFLGTIAIIVVLLGYPTQFLWNECLVGAIDGINKIEFFQAVGLNILCTILFRSSHTIKTNKQD